MRWRSPSVLCALCVACVLVVLCVLLFVEHEEDVLLAAAALSLRIIKKRLEIQIFLFIKLTKSTPISDCNLL